MIETSVELKGDILDFCSTKIVMFIQQDNPPFILSCCHILCPHAFTVLQCVFEVLALVGQKSTSKAQRGKRMRKRAFNDT